MVFQRLPIDGQPLIFPAFRAFDPLVESAPGLVAQPFVLEHVLEEVGEFEIVSLIANIRRHVADDVPQNIEPHQIDGAERGRLRPSHGLPGQRVDLLNRQPHFLHESHDIEHRESSNTVADEIRRVLGDNHALSQTYIREVRDRIDYHLVRFGSGNDFQQPHIPRRIKKVRAEPCSPEVVGESFRDLADRKPAGIGGDDGSRFADRLNFPEQTPLDLQVLNHGLDDPIDVDQFFEIVFEISHGHQARE